MTRGANFFQRHVVAPVLQLLRTGAKPRKLAWSIAIGVVIGVNPLLGSTTVVALLAAPLFGLNIVASQLGNHLVYPLELLLFPVFLRLGSVLFRTEHIPMEGKALLEAVKHHPWHTTRMLWTWEWHALVVWAIFAVVAAPLLEAVLRPLFVHMLERLHNEPVVEK